MSHRRAKKIRRVMSWGRDAQQASEITRRRYQEQKRAAQPQNRA